jgi:NAD(P)-dependent dehydrogenase (short-subunit alcohol dehydrogenase family)
LGIVDNVDPECFMDLGLSGKVAMVAGASRGLGFAVAQALGERQENLEYLEGRQQQSQG